MFGGGQLSHREMLSWIEDTFLSELLNDSSEEPTAWALKVGSVIIMTSDGLRIDSAE